MGMSKEGHVVVLPWIVVDVSCEDTFRLKREVLNM
jgi:hypothetical protein